MKKQLFREKNLDKVNSPEILDDYIRVTNPGVWLVMVALLVLLAGALIWGIFGSMESVIETQVVSQAGDVYCVVEGDDITAIENGMTVHVGDTQASVAGIFSSGEPGTYIVLLDAQLEEGIYSAEIVTKSVKPISLLLN